MRNNQKHRFWTFCLSCVPGAGEMYFGLYRTGLSLMLLCCAFVALAWFLDIFPLLLLCVVIWFYSFLHTHNLRAMRPEDFAQIEDGWLWEGFVGRFRWNDKLKVVLAVALIAVGFQQLWRAFYGPLAYLFGYDDELLLGILYNVPRAAVAVLIILAGVWLIRGRKRELDEEQQKDAPIDVDFEPVPEYRSEVEEKLGPVPEAPQPPQVNGEEAGDHADA